jgi:hypothetical protein
MTHVSIRPLSPVDVETAGELLAASHGEYPAFRLEFPDPGVRRRVLLPFQTAALATMSETAEPSAHSWKAAWPGSRCGSRLGSSRSARGEKPG